MSNVFRAHYERVVAEQAAAKAAADPGTQTMAGTTPHDQLMAQLTSHMSQLKGVQSTERKVALKSDFVATYLPYIDGVLSEEPGVDDPIVTEIMVWLVDLEQYEKAAEIALYASEYKLKMPQRFTRGLAVWMAEAFGEAAIAAEAEGADGPSLQVLMDIAEATDGADMPDQVSAKLHKALGFAFERDGEAQDLRSALFHYNRAIQLNEKCGLKKRRDDLDKKVNAASQDTGQGDTANGTQTQQSPA